MIKKWRVRDWALSVSFLVFPTESWMSCVCLLCGPGLRSWPESWEWDVGCVQWMVPVCWAGGAGGLKMFAGTWLRLLPGTGSQWPHPFHHQPRPRHWPLTRQYTTHLITRAWISNQLYGYVSPFWHPSSFNHSIVDKMSSVTALKYCNATLISIELM